MTNIPLDAERIVETISYYQVASYLYKHGLYNALTADEFADYMKQALGR